MPNLRIAIASIVGLFVSAGAVAILVNLVDLSAAGSVLVQANAAPVAAATAVLVAGVTVRIARWRLLLPTQAGVKRVSLRRLAAPLLIGYLGNVALPARLGEGLRAAAVWRRERIGLAEALGSVAAERVIDTAVVGLLGFGAAVWLAAPLWLITGTGFVALVAGTLLAILLSGMGIALTRWLTFVNGHWLRIARSAERFLRSASIQDRRAAVGAVILTMLAWILEALIVWLTASALSIFLHPLGAMLIAAVAILSTVIPAAPGYVGTYELAASAAGTALGLTPETALALAVLVHGVTLVPLMIAGLVAGMTVGIDLSSGRSSHPRNGVASTD